MVGLIDRGGWYPAARAIKADRGGFVKITTHRTGSNSCATGVRSAQSITRSPSAHVGYANGDFLEAFKSALREAGLSAPDVIPDGLLHRFHVDGDRRSEQNGWYGLFSDGLAAGAFGCWKRDRLIIAEGYAPQQTEHAGDAPTARLEGERAKEAQGQPLSPQPSEIRAGCAAVRAAQAKTPCEGLQAARSDFQRARRIEGSPNSPVRQ